MTSNTSDKPNTWNVAVLNIDWRADRHDESHSIEFERPTADNPSPDYPVVAGQELSVRRLPMSSAWGRLFATIVVEDFDEHTLTIRYGVNKYTLRPGEPWKKLDEGGMDYTTFWLFVGLKYVSPEENRK